MHGAVHGNEPIVGMRRRKVSVERFGSAYLIGTVIVWVSIMATVAVTLAGTPYFPQLLPLLGGGIAWFLVIVPGAIRTIR